jgi:hypothetical protein
MPTSLIQARLQRVIWKALDEIREEGSEMTEEELLGLMLATHFRWDGVKVLKTAAAALEDANYHGECEQVRKMITNIKRGIIH